MMDDYDKNKRAARISLTNTGSETVIKMTKKMDKEKNIYVSWMIWLSTGVVDYLNTSAIYIGYLTPALAEVLKQTLQYVFFPIYALNTAIYAALAINNVIVDRDPKTNNVKKENVVRMSVNLTSVALVTTAVIGTLAFPAVMGVACTFLFAINIGMTAIFNFAGAAYHFYHVVKQGRELKAGNLSAEDTTRITAEKTAHRSSAISYTAVATTICLVGLAGVLAVLGGFLPLAAIGVAAGLFGTAFCIYGIVKTVRNNKKAHQATAEQNADQPDSTHKVMRKLNSAPALSQRQKEINLISGTVDAIENIFHRHKIEGKQEETQPLLAKDTLRLRAPTRSQSTGAILQRQNFTI